MHWDQAQQRAFGVGILNYTSSAASALTLPVQEAVVLGKAARCTITAGSSLDVDPGDLADLEGKNNKVLETALDVVWPFSVTVA